ncbi:S-adenosyl-L-methionine-dependent methyltransferase [Mycena indigotica]|uniref:S-adenosyl-L-methionine-dependent methyltransferase n=1 Tax=Mycena indigotica TaxID=2126181 RepID=A0A8H6RXU5_9AGAR|nr:S-adenosyl-L-methionine-dependent methyltransferase [Mycena indigotica]KAF7288868.1 S-adenosyl-L-methionine-dependent methyltransferase [Mycena indigotica]
MMAQAKTLYHASGPLSTSDCLNASKSIHRPVPITPSSLAYHAKTLWLFTESDVMTMLVPVSVFAMVAAPLTTYANIPHLLFWLWLHVLTFNTSNQTTSSEDATNKPHRPIPAGRITFEHARILRWALVPICGGLSLMYSKETMLASVVVSFLTVTYNELRCDGRSAISRNLLNGLGYAAFEAGTTLVARDNKTSLDPRCWRAILLSGLLFATTIYAQDFRDVVGDAELRRDTIPLRFGAQARPFLMASVVLWSIALSWIWQLDTFTATAFVVLGAFAGGRFVLKTTIDDDRRSYFWYNVGYPLFSNIAQWVNEGYLGLGCRRPCSSRVLALLLFDLRILWAVYPIESCTGAWLP